MIDEKLKIGQRIQAERERQGLKQSDIAKKIGVATSTISRYEKGKFKEIKIPVIASIASTLNVSLDWILGKSADKSVTISDIMLMTAIDMDAYDNPELFSIPGGSEMLDCFLQYSSVENKPDATITDEEIELIKKYRQLDSRGKETVEIILDREYNLAARAANTTQKQPVNDRERELEEFRANWKREREEQKKSVPAKEKTV